MCKLTDIPKSSESWIRLRDNFCFPDLKQQNNKKLVPALFDFCFNLYHGHIQFDWGWLELFNCHRPTQIFSISPLFCVLGDYGVDGLEDRNWKSHYAKPWILVWEVKFLCFLMNSWTTPWLCSKNALLEVEDYLTWVITLPSLKPQNEH